MWQMLGLVGRHDHNVIQLDETEVQVSEYRVSEEPQRYTIFLFLEYHREGQKFYDKTRQFTK